MSDLPKAEIRAELMALTKAPRRGSKAESPMQYVKKCCPTLLKLMPEVVSLIGIEYVDAVEFAKALLEEVAFNSDAVKVQQAGDLLGLTPNNIDTRQLFDEYKNKSRSDAPKEYFRFNRQVRQIIAAHRDGFGHTITRNAQDEPDWMEEFVDELCTYLDNKDDKLVSFAHKCGYLSGDEADTNIALASPAKIQHSDKSTELPISATDYVHRTQIEERFRTLVEQGAKLIAFVGFAGMGKTSIARAMTEGSPFIEVHDGKPHLNGLQVALERYCQDRKMTVTSENALSTLATLLSIEQGPRFVVLDNLQSTNELRELVPFDVNAIVIATCRESGDSAPPWLKEIDIDKMEETEAVELAKLLLPSLNDEDAVFIADTLEGYPLIIEAACGYVNVAGVDARDLCRSLQIGPGHIKTKADERLRNVVELLVQVLRESDPIATELLACLASFDNLGSGYLLTDPLYCFVREYYGFDIAPSAYAGAIRTLRNTFLVTFWRFDSNPREVMIYIGIHPLIRVILFNILMDDAARVDVMLYECLERLVEEVRLRIQGCLRIQGQSNKSTDVNFEPPEQRLIYLSKLLTRTSSPLEIEGVQHVGLDDTGETRRSWFMFEYIRMTLALNGTSMDIREWIARITALNEYRPFPY